MVVAGIEVHDLGNLIVLPAREGENAFRGLLGLLLGLPRGCHTVRGHLGWLGSGRRLCSARFPRGRVSTWLDDKPQKG